MICCPSLPAPGTHEEDSPTCEGWQEGWRGRRDWRHCCRPTLMLFLWWSLENSRGCPSTCEGWQEGWRGHRLWRPCPPVLLPALGHPFWRPCSPVLACRPRGTRNEDSPTCKRSLERPLIQEALLSFTLCGLAELMRRILPTCEGWPEGWRGLRGWRPCFRPA